jgi:predicted metalloprotease
MEWQGNRTSENVANRRRDVDGKMVFGETGVVVQSMEWFVRGFKVTTIEEGNTFKHYSNNS